MISAVSPLFQKPFAAAGIFFRKQSSSEVVKCENSFPHTVYSSGRTEQISSPKISIFNPSHNERPQADRNNLSPNCPEHKAALKSKKLFKKD